MWNVRVNWAFHLTRNRYLAPVIGWLGDFFRFWWALFYWNIRKTWFRLRGAHRDSCPCQNFSDSGLALDSRCEAVVHWHQASRFRRICPLLTETADGWRCSVDAERVRPFWGRAFGYGFMALFGVYLVAAGLVFATLRLAQYEIGYGTVVWPGHWGEIRQAREKLYANRAQRAMTEGNYNEAILALEQVCQLNPRNYQAGLALANLSQVASRPTMADYTYERLYREMPEQRITTAQIWFRALLTRGAYDKIKPLAAAMLMEDVSERSIWLNALLFSARATRDSEILNTALNHRHSLPEWCNDLLEIERDLLTHHEAEALPRLVRIYRQPETAYLPYYQIDRLIRAGRLADAQTVLTAYGAQLPEETTSFLRLRLFQAHGWKSLLKSEYENLLRPRLTAPTAGQLCAYLMLHPDRALSSSFGARFDREYPTPTAETLPLFHATYLAAVVSGDQALAGSMLEKIRLFTRSDARVVQGLAELLPHPDARLPRILPLVPLPIEVVYAILERQQPKPKS